MKPVDPEGLGRLPTPAAVYLLQRRDGLRFKIGWALEPRVRVQRLPEFFADALDLGGSHAVWLPTAKRAQQSERALHRGLATWRVLPGHALDGHTEWFLPAAHRNAIRLIRQMPVGADATLPPPVVAFLSEPDERLLEPAGHTHSAVVVLPQDTLWDMEDLLLRVAACCAVAVESAGDGYTIRLIGFRSRVSGTLETLRWGVLNIDRYRWRSGEQAGLCAPDGLRRRRPVAAIDPDAAHPHLGRRSPGLAGAGPAGAAARTGRASGHGPQGGQGDWAGPASPGHRHRPLGCAMNRIVMPGDQLAWGAALAALRARRAGPPAPAGCRPAHRSSSASGWPARFRCGSCTCGTGRTCGPGPPASSPRPA